MFTFPSTMNSLVHNTNPSYTTKCLILLQIYITLSNLNATQSRKHPTRYFNVLSNIGKTKTRKVYEASYLAWSSKVAFPPKKRGLGVRFGVLGGGKGVLGVWGGLKCCPRRKTPTEGVQNGVGGSKVLGTRISVGGGKIIKNMSESKDGCHQSYILKL